MFISKWQPPLTAILKTKNCITFKSKYPISTQLHQNVQFSKYI